MTQKEFAGYVRIVFRAAFVRPIQVAFRSEPGSDRFRRNFLPEGLVPTSAEDRERLREASRCIHCGLCDAAAIGVGVSPSLVPLVFARTAVELPLAGRELALLLARPELLEVGERLCPERVPLVRLARWLGERLERVREAAAEAA